MHGMRASLGLCPAAFNAQVQALARRAVV